MSYAEAAAKGGPQSPQEVSLSCHDCRDQANSHPGVSTQLVQSFRKFLS